MSTVSPEAAGIVAVVVASPISNPSKSTSGALNRKDADVRLMIN